MLNSFLNFLKTKIGTVEKIFHRKLFLVIAPLLVTTFFFGMIFDRYFIDNIFSYLNAEYRKVVLIGDGENYVKEQLARQYKERKEAAPLLNRTLDTSRLPLSVSEFRLAETGQFASEVGGAITNADGALLVMDRLGNIFLYANDSIRKMDYGEFPSNLDGFVRESPNATGQFLAFKAHSIAYDGVHSVLYVSTERFNSASKKQRFNISAISIDRKSFKKTGKWRTIFETEDMTHERNGGAAGGKLIVSGNFLYFTIGDYDLGKVPERKAQLAAQETKSPFGKIYEQDLVTYKIKMKSIGHRNPQGLVFTSDRKLIDAEHGPEGGDELNIIVDGRNYGWPFKTYGTDYGKFNWPITFKEPKVVFTEPLYAWVPSAAISSIIQVTKFHENWNGDLLVGSLKAQSLYRLKEIDGRVIFSEPIWIGHRIRDIAEWKDSIVLMTDDPSLLFIRVDRERFQGNSKVNSLAELNPALSACLSCHHFGATNSSHTAPTLEKIIGRPIAGDSFQNYSEALKAKTGDWDEASLRKFISNPDEFAPGTRMPNPNIPDEQISEIIELLKN